jgi:excisionase family DNA binding protein
MTAKEAAAYLQVSRDTLYRWMNSGLLPWYEVPGKRGRRFKRGDLDAVFQRRQAKRNGG